MIVRKIPYQITADCFPDPAVKLTVKGFLKSRGYSVQAMKQLKSDPDGITLNGETVFLNAPLSAGDLLSVCVSETQPSQSILPVDLPIGIIYEDEDLLVVDKPAGMPIHPSQNNRDNTLANALAFYYAQAGRPFVFRCINRLDRDTSGLTVIAKHFLSAGILGTYVAAKSLSVDHCADPALSSKSLRSLHREYLAIVRGHVTPSSGTIDAPLGRKPGSVIERCIDYEHGETAVTNYTVVAEKNGYSLLSLILETGRTHQIRIHMKHLGYPLIGDYLYNPDFEEISRQALHSHRLAFPHPVTGIPLSFTAPLPDDMQRILC